MKRTIHIDTYFATKDAVTNNPAVKSVSKLSQPIRASKISLASIELTNTLPNIRTGVNTLILQHIPTSTSKTYTVNAGDYTDIAVLCTALNALMTANPLVSGLTLNFTTTTDGNNIKIQNNSPNNFRVLPSIFGTEILGFTNQTWVSNELVASNSWNLAADTYIWLRLNNLNSNALTTNPNQRGFRIALPSQFGFVQCQTDETGIVKQHIELDGQTTLTEIECCLYDKYNNAITVPFANYSFSLEVTLDC